jgi:hypothetical protein
MKGAVDRAAYDAMMTTTRPMIRFANETMA